MLLLNKKCMLGLKTKCGLPSHFTTSRGYVCLYVHVYYTVGVIKKFSFYSFTTTVKRLSMYCDSIEAYKWSVVRLGFSEICCNYARNALPYNFSTGSTVKATKKAALTAKPSIYNEIFGGIAFSP